MSLQCQGYQFYTFEKYIQLRPTGKIVVMRHDVDRLPFNALKMATIEKGLGIITSYYFRIIPSVWDVGIVQSIVDMGHEVSYHYEDLSLSMGNYDKAILVFKRHLSEIRQYYPTKTICMHGSPTSKWDNREIWKYYNYRDFGIIGEPYFDVDYSIVFYITDTGRSWNNLDYSLRDRVESPIKIPIKNTFDLINHIEKTELPDSLMLNIHPHRWNNFGYRWLLELIVQNMKNEVKRMIVFHNEK